MEFVEYVAGSDENEAKFRYEAGLGRELFEAAQVDAIRREQGDLCDPKCHYQVYRVTVTLEKQE